MSTRLLRFGTTVCMFWCLSTTAVVMAEEKTKKESSKAKAVPAESIDLFEGMENGKLEVRFLPKDATLATIVINNKTDKPLDIRLPDAFGGVPVLAQGMGMGGMGGMGMGGMGGMGGGMGGMGGMGGGMGGMGGGQGMGGGMGGMGGGMGGLGGMGGMGGGGMGGMGMGGMMRVEADKAAKLKVPTVCLEHGKKDPNPRMKYKLVRLDEVNPDPRVRELCKLLGTGKLPQNTAQAAAWHIANGLTWEQLAHKDRVVSRYASSEKWFSPLEIQNALGLVNIVTVAAKQSQEAAKSEGARDTYSGSYTGDAAKGGE